MPEISVLIPYYNDEDFIADSINSVLTQSFSDFELILLNHASTDSTRNIAHSFSDNRIRHFDMEKNNGAGGGIILKKFLECANGNYLKLFCADDIMEHNCLEELHKYLKSHPDMDIVFGDAEYVDSFGNSLMKKWSEKFESFSFAYDTDVLLRKYFQRETFLPLPASMFKSSSVAGILIDTSIIMEFDQSLWIQMMINEKKFGFVNSVVTKYRIHDGQESSQKKRFEISCYDFYESIVRARFFFSIRTLHQMKNLLADYYLLSMVEEADFEYFPFIIACYYLSEHKDAGCKIVGYEYLHECFENETMREKLLKKFNFDVADFRSMYKAARLPFFVPEKSNISFKSKLKKSIKKIFSMPRK